MRLFIWKTVNISKKWNEYICTAHTILLNTLTHTHTAHYFIEREKYGILCRKNIFSITMVTASLLSYCFTINNFKMHRVFGIIYNNSTTHIHSFSFCSFIPINWRSNFLWFIALPYRAQPCPMCIPFDLMNPFSTLKLWALSHFQFGT